MCRRICRRRPPHQRLPVPLAPVLDALVVVVAVEAVLIVAAIAAVLPGRVGAAVDIVAPAVIDPHAAAAVVNT